MMELVSEQLSGLKSGLAEINASLSDGIQQLRDIRPTAETGSKVRNPPVRVRDSDGEDRDGEDSDGESGSGPYEITVINKIPPTLVSVLKQQFKLRNKWMHRIHKATVAQRADNKKLLTHLEECAELYVKLIERIEGR